MNAVDLNCAIEGPDLAFLKRAGQAIAGAAADLKADNDAAARREIRERLQVLQFWKITADETEGALIEQLEGYLEYLLDPERIPTSSHHPDYWREKAAEDRDMYRAEQAEELESAFQR